MTLALGKQLMLLTRRKAEIWGCFGQVVFKSLSCRGPQRAGTAKALGPVPMVTRMFHLT